MTEPVRTVGSRLTEMRIRRDLSQEQVAREAGVHPVTVSKWETDTQCPSGNALVVLAALFGVSTDWLLREHEEDIDHNVRDRTAALTPVISYPALIVHVKSGTLSDEAIEELDEYIGFLRERDRRRRKG